MIPKDKIEEAASNYSGKLPYDNDYDAFKAGVKFAEKELENLAIEFAEWQVLNSEPFIDENKVQSWALDNKVGFLSSKELFQQFIKERNETTD